jgi:hypothetical protein
MEEVAEEFTKKEFQPSQVITQPDTKTGVVHTLRRPYEKIDANHWSQYPLNSIKRSENSEENDIESLVIDGLHKLNNQPGMAREHVQALFVVTIEKEYIHYDMYCLK